MMIGTAMQIISWLTKQKEGQLWEIKKHTKKRTLSQNAYFHVLIGQMADVLKVPKSEVHNQMLRAYGQPMGIDGRVVTVTLPDSEKAERNVLRMETVHLKPTSQVKLGTKNQMFRTYVMLRGSHELNTEEMAILLDGVIGEAQNIGIETITPRERAMLK